MTHVTAMHLRAVASISTALSLVMVAGWFGVACAQSSQGGATESLLWAVFGVHALLCLLAWAATREGRPHQTLLILYAAVQFTQLVVCTIVVLAFAASGTIFSGVQVVAVAAVVLGVLPCVVLVGLFVASAVLAILLSKVKGPMSKPPEDPALGPPPPYWEAVRGTQAPADPPVPVALHHLPPFHVAQMDSRPVIN
eukprot:m51a1_g10027 hypothetical protein (196) ;mRNA; f:105920-106572